MADSSRSGWLRMALERGMCPLCHAAHELDRAYMRQFFELSFDREVLDRISAARGFCSAHADQLRRIEVDVLRSTVTISDVYEYTLRGLAADLASMDDDDEWLAAATCPACESRGQGEAENARYLLEELVASDTFRDDTFRSPPGLCVRHFRFVWDVSRTKEERTLLREAELHAVRSLLDEVREHLRKERAELRHESPGPEIDSWLRALWLTGGWPPPNALASVPQSN